MDEAVESPQHERHYTVEQANAALPWVSERLVRIRDGAEVYLCWMPGEERVAWWHDPEAGFAGRRPL